MVGGCRIFVFHFFESQFIICGSCPKINAIIICLQQHQLVDHHYSTFVSLYQVNQTSFYLAFGMFLISWFICCIAFLSFNKRIDPRNHMMDNKEQRCEYSLLEKSPPSCARARLVQKFVCIPMNLCDLIFLPSSCHPILAQLLETT